MTRPPTLTWTPFVLLGLLTIATMGGPVAILLTFRGGASPGWPPDRPVEWWTFGLCTGIVVVLMSACLLIGLARHRRSATTRINSTRGPDPDVDRA
jgi:hypothetical protein